LTFNKGFDSPICFKVPSKTAVVTSKTTAEAEEEAGAIQL
jgi:hypothetical protein